MNWAVMFGREKKDDQRALVAMLHPKIPFQPRPTKKKAEHDSDGEADQVS